MLPQQDESSLEPQEFSHCITNWHHPSAEPKHAASQDVPAIALLYTYDEMEDQVLGCKYSKVRITSHRPPARSRQLTASEGLWPGNSPGQNPQRKHSSCLGHCPADGTFTVVKDADGACLDAAVKQAPNGVAPLLAIAGALHAVNGHVGGVLGVRVCRALSAGSLASNWCRSQLLYRAESRSNQAAGVHTACRDLICWTVGQTATYGRLQPQYVGRQPASPACSPDTMTRVTMYVNRPAATATGAATG